MLVGETLRYGSVHLVGRHVNEPADTVAIRRIEQHASTNDVGLEEDRRAIDRPINMAFCGEVHDNVVTGHDLVDEGGIANVPLDEAVSGILVEFGDGCRNSRVRHGVKVRDRGIRFVVKHATDEVRSDESGAAGDQIPASHDWSPYSKTSALRSDGASRSLSESIGSMPMSGHSMSMSGSSHWMLRSCSDE